MAPSQPDGGLPCSGLHGIPWWVTPRERLATARLYLVCPAMPRDWIAAAVRGGVDLIQLRDKTLDDAGLVEAAQGLHGPRRALHPQRPPRPGRRRAAPTASTSARTTTRLQVARAAVGPDRIVGRSTHAPDQAKAAQEDPDVDYLAVGPVHATPTKPGRPAAGLHYVAHAAGAVTSRGSRSAGSTRATCTRSSSAARPGSSWCARSPTRRTPRPRRGSCAPRWRAASVPSAEPRDEPRRRGRRRGRRRTPARRRARPAARSARPAAAPSRGRGWRAGTRARAPRPRRSRRSCSRSGPTSGRSASSSRSRWRSSSRVANLVGAALGAGGESPAVGVVFAVLMAGLAVGLWQRRYLVILLFQALLALSIIVFALVAGVRQQPARRRCSRVAVIGLCSPVFWLLVRVMARLQVPRSDAPGGDRRDSRRGSRRAA